VIASISMLAMASLNTGLAVIFFAILALAYIWFHFIVKPEKMSPQPLSPDKILQQLAEQNTEKIKLAVTDLDGILRGKMISFDKFSGILEKGFGFCNVVFGWDSGDVAYDKCSYTGWHTGYPDAIAIIDLDSFPANTLGT
jgi:hypothetical protein